jgi:hypothetical protein
MPELAHLPANLDDTSFCHAQLMWAGADVFGPLSNHVGRKGAMFSGRTIYDFRSPHLRDFERNL